MGKRLIQQRRGRGTLTYRTPGHRFAGALRLLEPGHNGIVKEIIHCPGHTAPLIRISTAQGVSSLAPAPEGIRVGDKVACSPAVEANDAKVKESKEPGTDLNWNDAGVKGYVEVKEGNVLPLSSIPEGTPIHNIEIRPGDGGKLVRTSGTFARIVAKTAEGICIKLPSRKEKILLPACRAAVGIVAGSGRLEKPFLTAGSRAKRMWARNKLYPKVCGVSMNAVDHPFGSKGSHTKGRPTQSPRDAPPGRKVGKIAPRRTGRKK